MPDSPKSLQDIVAQSIANDKNLYEQAMQPYALSQPMVELVESKPKGAWVKRIEEFKRQCAEYNRDWEHY